MYIRAAGPLTVTVLSIAICNIFHLSRAPANIKVVGTVPAVRHSAYPPVICCAYLLPASGQAVQPPACLSFYECGNSGTLLCRGCRTRQ